MHARKVWAAIALLVALTMGASACSGGGDPGQGAQSQAPSATANDANPLPREQLADSGTLRWPIAGLPPNFNYHQIDGMYGPTRDVVFALLPLAFEADAMATPRLNTELLEFAQVTATSPKQVVTYRINPQAVWSDGAPITWRDFEAQWRALNGTDPAYLIAQSNGYNQVESVVRGADEREAIVTFSSPYSDWEGMYRPLYPASTTSDPAVFNTGWMDGPLASAGPFRFGSVDRTAQTITLVRDERWWGQPAKLDQIIFRVIDSDALGDALANDEIDWMDVGPNVSSYQRVQGIPGIDIRTAGGPNFRHITMNGTSEFLRDVTVRRALSLAIDRQAIAQALIGPLGVPAEALGNHIFMRNQAGYQDNGVPYDPDQARALLEEAGWRLDGDVRSRDGQEFALRLVIPSGVVQARQEAELTQGMLADVGVRVSIEAVPSDQFFPVYVNIGDFDLTIFTWLGDPYPVGSQRSIYLNPRVGPDGQPIVEQNYARVGSPEIDLLFTRANAELDPGLATQLLNQVDTLIWEAGHSVTMYQRPDIFAGKATLANFGAKGFADWIYEDIGYARPGEAGAERPTVGGDQGGGDQS
ncbi:MAG: ABC transporter family substrate-binding protein [Egibacteraceae bacterium]